MALESKAIESSMPVTENVANASERTLSVFVHLGGIVFGFLPSLIVWLIKKDDPAEQYTAAQAKDALNFQLTIAIAFFVSFVLIFVIIGALLLWLVWLADVVLSIVAAVKTNSGENYRYPFTLRLIK